MAKYTIQVRSICENASGLNDSVGFNDVNRVIQNAIPKVFDFDFPIYDESYRNVLCTKILKHYYMREIGAETVGLWKLWLDARLNEIMPYYNELYKSTMIEFNPMYDIDLTTTHTRDNDGTTDVTSGGLNTEKRIGTIGKEETQEGSTHFVGHSEDNNVNRNMFSDTPQGALDNVENMTYLTDARKITDDNENDTENDTNTNSTNISDTTVNDSVERESENESKTVATSTEEYLQTIKGKSGGASYSKRLQEFRSTFINIDSMIIGELKDLFMNLW